MLSGMHGDCPVCRSKLLNFPKELVNGENNSILLPAECLACGSTWLQRYTFSGHESIEEGTE